MGPGQDRSGKFLVQGGKDLGHGPVRGALKDQIKKIFQPEFFPDAKGDECCMETSCLAQDDALADDVGQRVVAEKKQKFLVFESYNILVQSLQARWGQRGVGPGLVSFQSDSDLPSGWGMVYLFGDFLQSWGELHEQVLYSFAGNSKLKK